MTFASSRIVTAAKSRLKTTVGKRFSRFVLVAAAAVAASQITLTICLGVVGMTAGKSAVAAWLAGAAVSYVLSRWAWERKGRPNLIKETLPFWAVAVGTAVVLTLTTKYANQQAQSMNLSHGERILFVDSAYFFANCLTFLTRFVIFHYVLFADRGPKTATAAAPARGPEATAASNGQRGASAEPRPSASVDGTGPDPLGTGPAVRVNGSPAWAAGAVAPEAAVPERGPRR
jgi:putative flippase GtrA